MKYIGVKEAAAKWGLSDRRVRLLCSEGKIEGACKLEWSWTLPEDTPRPSDGRSMRHLKNLDMRLGTIDITALDNMKKLYPITEDILEDENFKSICINNLETALALESRKYHHNQIVKVLSGLIAPSLPLADHLLYINFRTALLRSFADKDPFNSRRFTSVYGMLTHGIDDINGGRFREGGAETPMPGKENFDVVFLMEMLSRQFESDYKLLHPVFRGVILYTEILRIKPFDHYNEEMALLLLDAMLLSSGFLLPLLDASMVNEMKAAASLAFRRGNYQDLARVFERSILAAYKEVFDV